MSSKKPHGEQQSSKRGISLEKFCSFIFDCFQEMIDQQRSHEENIRQLQEKMEKDKEELMKAQQEQLNKKIKEQEEMLKKGQPTLPRSQCFH